MKPRLGAAREARAALKFYGDPPPKLRAAESRRIISAEEFHQILDTLKKDIKLEHLDLSRSDIDDDQVKQLIDALLTNNTLKSLNLSETNITKLGVLALIQFVNKQLHQTLKEINVSSNRLHPSFAKKLAYELEFNEICRELKHHSEDYKQIMNEPTKDMPKNPLMRRSRF